MDVAPAERRTFLDVPVDLRPRACLSPFFGLTEDDFERCVRGGSLGAAASLVVEGRGSVVLEDVHVRAGSALRVTTGPGTKLVVRGLVVDNAGGSLVESSVSGLADWSATGPPSALTVACATLFVAFWITQMFRMVYAATVDTLFVCMFRDDDFLQGKYSGAAGPSDAAPARR